ncbi:MAG: DNA alkylation repair protein [Eubacteriales bacterium]|nr:DNA alkylation repair protein [Eubacteriales bacterium]
MTYRERLLQYRDEKNAAFQRKLTPGPAEDSFLGVRVPDCRKLARELVKEGGYESFFSELPHTYFDENMLHGVMIAELKDADRCIEEIERFLPYIDNWAVCDSMNPKVFKKNREQLLPKIRKWIGSKDTYTCRFGIGMLMTHYLDEGFREEYLELPAAVRSSEYYVNMMIAWFFATALAKQWDAAFPYIREQKLAPWVHNKTIQKAVESRRISEEQKTVLRKLKV